MGFWLLELEELTSFKPFFEARNNGKLICINLNDIRFSNLKSQKDHKDGFFLLE